MNLLQISDPKQAKDKLKKFVVGIDLGTTNSLIAMRNTATKFYIENESTMMKLICLMKNFLWLKLEKISLALLKFQP